MVLYDFVSSVNGVPTHCDAVDVSTTSTTIHEKYHLTFVQLMMDALSLRPPSLSSKSNLAAATTVTNTPSVASVATGSSAATTTASVSLTHEQMHMIRARELIAAQAKTSSFRTYPTTSSIRSSNNRGGAFADPSVNLMPPLGWNEEVSFE